MKIEDVIEKYVSLRDRRSELKKNYEVSDNVLKEAMEKIEAWLLGKLDKDGIESTKTPFGTAYISKKVRATCSDWTSFWELVSKTGRFDFLERRVSSGAIKEYLEEGHDLPQGLNLHTERVVNVRRS